MVFGKNYDAQIKDLNEALNKLVDVNNSTVRQTNELMELFTTLQESMIGMAKVQAQHKQFIQFFVNHGTVDVDAQEDLMKMIQEMSKIDKIGGKNEKTKSQRK